MSSLPSPRHSRGDFAEFSYRVEPVPFARFMEEVLEGYRPPMRAKATFIKMRQVLAIVAELLGPDGTTDQLTMQLVARFIASRPPAESNNSTLSLLSSLRAACTIAMGMGYVRISPFVLRKAWLRQEKSRRPRQHLSREEIAAVLARAEDEIEKKKHHSQASPWAVWRCRRLHALVATVAYTGLRRNEALHLRVEDVDLAGGLLHVVDRQANRLKTEGSARAVPIPGPLATILAGWIPEARSDWLFPNSTHHGPWTGGQPGHKPLCRLKALGKRAGVPDLTFLALRHSYATHAEFWGLTAEQIARVMGHTNLKTQRGYRHEDRPNLREMFRDIADRIKFLPGEGDPS